MADFSPSKKTISDFNNGQKYRNGVDTPNADDFNGVIESQIWTQSLATNQPDIENAGLVGTPSVSIEEVDGLPRLKFENLKGEKGQDGKDHSSEILTLNNEVTALKNEQKQQNILIRNNTLAVEGVYAILENTVTDKVKMTSQYTTRQTANGNQDIIDGSLTPVNLIAGDTVASGSELKHAYFKAIKSTGRNLLKPKLETGTTKGLTYTHNGGGSVTVKGTPTDTSVIRVGDFTGKDISTGNYYYSTNDSNVTPYAEGYLGGKYSEVLKECDSVLNVDFSKGTYDTVVLFLLIRKGVAVDTTVYPMFNYGDTKHSFEPYTESLFEIPQELELGKWDSLNPQTGELKNGNARIEFDGSEDWFMELTYTAIGGNGYRIGIHLSDFKVTAGNNIEDEDIIVNMYNIITAEETYLGNKIGASSGGKDIMYLYDPKYCATSDISLWKAHLAELYAAGTPLIVEYKKATPTVETLDNIPKSYKAYKGGSETVVQGETDNSEYGAMPEIKQEYYTQKGGK